MIAQISDKNYLTASFKSELDNSKDCEFCSITITADFQKKCL